MNDLTGPLYLGLFAYSLFAMFEWDFSCFQSIKKSIFYEEAQVWQIKMTSNKKEKNGFTFFTLLSYLTGLVETQCFFFFGNDDNTVTHIFLHFPTGVG